MQMYVSDSHTDLLTFPFCVKSKKGGYFDRFDYEFTKSLVLEYLSKQNLSVVSLAVFTRGKNIDFQDFQNFKLIIEEYNSKKLGEALFSVEDLSFTNNFYDLENLVKLKPFSCALTWNFDNQFGGGSFGKSGLTNFGEFAVKYLEGNNVLVDTAHMNRKTFLEFSKISTKPIFNSHANIFSLHKHKRNLLDREIKTIVESNGYMGITLYDKFIKGKEIDSFDVVTQFNYLVEKFGINSFGFGTDFFGIDQKNLPRDIASYHDLVKVAEHLLTFGYRDKDIKKLMSQNFSDFVRRVRN